MAMLKMLRKKTRVIIWTVIVAFVLWGGFSVGLQFKKEARFAGEVFGQDVTFQEFDRFYKSVQIFTFADKPVESAEAFRQTAWQSLIYSREAKKRRIEVSDAEVRQKLIDLLAQYQIPQNSYEEWVQRTMKVTSREFESQLREIIRIQKLMAEIAGGIAVDPKTVEDIARHNFFEENKAGTEAEFEAAKEGLIQKAAEERKHLALIEQLQEILLRSRLRDYQAEGIATAPEPPSF